MDLGLPFDTRDRRRLFTAGTSDIWSRDTPADSEVVSIDTSMVHFIDPMGLAMIAAVAENAAAQGRSVLFTPPEHEGVRNYMARMHVADCLEQFCSDVRLPVVREWNTPYRQFELQRFDATSGDRLAERVFQALLAEGSPEADAASFFKGISEVVNNVAEHSGVNGGWAAMQAMPNADGLITFAVADAGAGLELTLSRQYVLGGAVHAMETAFLRAFSGTGARGRGTGLDDLLQRVQRYQGQLRARSGIAIGHSAGGPLTCREAQATFPGTVIYAGFKPGRQKVLS